MPELQCLRADHATAVLAFEVVNRPYFARFISDRGDAYFEHFSEQFTALLRDQEAGVGAFHVLIADDGTVVGRFNLEFVEEGVAVLGYRVAEQVAGQGVATATVGELRALASSRYGIRTIRAATATANVASQRVLLKAGFVAAGPADPSDLGGKQGTWWEAQGAASSACSTVQGR